MATPGSMSVGCVGIAMTLTVLLAMTIAMTLAVLQMESARFLEFVTLTTCQREADQPYRKENLTQKFHGHPFNRGTASLQLPSSRIYSASANDSGHHDAAALVPYHLERLTAWNKLAFGNDVEELSLEYSFPGRAQVRRCSPL
jgi:hypothetical protein